MSLIDSLRRRLRVERQDAEIAASLERAERLLREGAPTPQIQALGTDVLSRLEASKARHNEESAVQFAAASLFAGELEQASRYASAAASARPYDVDSRIVHGNVRLARNELEEAAHEFDAVIEEFGADSDAAAGRRAVILARGEGPFDELPAGPSDWSEAATLLIGLWQLAVVAEERLRALSGGHPDTLSLLRNQAREIRNGGGGDGTV